MTCKLGGGPWVRQSASLWDDDIIVSLADFYAVYFKPTNQPQLILRRRTDTDDHELLARAWQAANDKARELGWIV